MSITARDKRSSIGMKAKKAIFICQITENSLKVIKCLLNNSKGEFVGLENEAILSDIDSKNLTERLLQAFRKLEYNNNPVIISLPRSRVTCRYLKVPTEIPNEIEKIVSLQASRYLPYPINELITGYQIISSDKEGFSNVNLIIVHKDAIDYHIKMLQSLNIKNPKIILSSYGLCNLYNYIRPEDTKQVMIIDVDSQQAELAITSNQKLLFSRYFRFNRAEPGWKDLFIEEINKTRDAYSKEVSQDAPAKIILMGAGRILEELAPILNQRVNLPVEILSYDTKINLSENLLNSVLNSDASFASIIGLGLKDAEEALNLMPQDIKKEVKKVYLRKERLRLILSISFIALVLGLGIAKDLDNKAQYLDKLKIEINKIIKEAKLLEEIEKRFQFLESRSQKKPKSLEILYELHQVVSAGVSLINFSYEEDKQVVLRGQTSELNYVSNFVSGLQESPSFKSFNIKIKYATRKNTQTGELIDFEIVCSKK